MLSAVDWSGVATKRGHSLWSARPMIRLHQFCVDTRFTRRGDCASLTAILKGRFIYVGSFEVEHD